MKIRVYTENDFLSHWPIFTTFNAAFNYIKNNSGEFNNGDIIALVDFENQETKFVEARFRMEFFEIEKD